MAKKSCSINFVTTGVINADGSQDLSTVSPKL
jgi:hypothetical protein